MNMHVSPSTSNNAEKKSISIQRRILSITPIADHPPHTEQRGSSSSSPIIPLCSGPLRASVVDTGAPGVALRAG